MSCDIDPHITSKYDIRKRIGKGAYGIVWKSIDRRTGEIVALKKIFDAFINPTDAQRTYREIMFLQEFSSHENVIQLQNVIKAKNDIDIYLVFEFMDTDLHAVIKGGILMPIHHQYIMYQLFNVMTYIHSGNCIHRDLKPSNILLNADCFVKLADFGLARSLSTEMKDSDSTVDPTMTDYVATRWYRAPEILLGSHKYTKGVDMWSLGCILAEMIAGKALFPGTSTMDQIDRILKSIPKPNKKDIDSIQSPFAKTTMDRLMSSGHIPLSEIVRSAPSDALDLISKLLQFNPDNRLTAKQSLRHQFVDKFIGTTSEPELTKDVIPFLNDNIQLSIEEYRDKLYENILEKRKSLIKARSQIKKTNEQHNGGSSGEVLEDIEGKDEEIDGSGAGFVTSSHQRPEPSSIQHVTGSSTHSPVTSSTRHVSAAVTSTTHPHRPAVSATTHHPLASSASSPGLRHNGISSPARSTRPTSSWTKKATKPPLSTKTLDAGHMQPTAASLPYYAANSHQRTTFNKQKSALAVNTKHTQHLGGDRGHQHVRGAWPPAQPPRPPSGSVHPHHHQSVDQSHSPSRPSRSGQKSMRTSQQQQKQTSMDGLVVTSARIIPSTRPQDKGRRAARGVPTKYASGSYTQTHGVISSSDLAKLKENRW